MKNEGLLKKIINDEEKNLEEMEEEQVEEVANAMVGSVKVCKMDVDSNQELAVQYGVRSIPTLIIFKNGEVSSTQIGAISKQQLEEFIAAEI